MSVVSRKSKVGKWGCLVCKSLKNSTLEKKCAICGAMRAPDRFGFSLMEVYYLCHVNTARAFPQVTITRLSPPESTSTVKLPEIQESLFDAVVEAVTNLATKAAPSSAMTADTSNCERSSSAVSLHQEQQQENQHLDLYHKVMHKAKDLEYDTVMGQFVPTAAGTTTTSEHPLNYVQSMQKQKDVMDKLVQDTILSRVEETESPHKDLNPNVDTQNEWKAKVPCALCGYPFPPSQLMGNISNHSILNWLKEHKASTDSKECKKLALQAYEAAKMCLFCTQFFDENYADTFDVEMSANEEFRSRRKEEKKQKKKESKEDKAIAKLNEKLSIAELKSKKETHGIRFRGSQDEEILNAEQIMKLQSEKRSMKFHEAKEKFRRHKATLAKQSATSRAKSTGNLPAVDKKHRKNITAGEVGKNSKEGNYTSRSTGTNDKNSYKKSASDTKLQRVKKKRNRQQPPATNKNILPAIVPASGSLGVMDSEGDIDSLASIEASVESIDEALNANTCNSDSSPKKKKVQKKKKSKTIVHRMTKKEISRLELLKEIAEKKVKQEKRFKSRKLHRESDWSDVRVGQGGEEKDIQVFRDKEKRAAMLIAEYEREMSNQQESLVKNIPDDVIDRPGWDNRVVKNSSDMVEEESDDEYDEEDEDEDVIVVKETSTPLPSDLLGLKPTISLEMIQQHKQHLQAMHLKHLETHVNKKNLEEQSRPLTKEAPIRTSITKDMLNNHKKHVLSMKNITTTVSDKPMKKQVLKTSPVTNSKQTSKHKSHNTGVRPGVKVAASSKPTPTKQDSSPPVRKSELRPSRSEMSDVDGEDSDYDDDYFVAEDDFVGADDDQKQEEEEEKATPVPIKKVPVKKSPVKKKKKITTHNHDDMDDVGSQVMDDDDMVTPAMVDSEPQEEKKEVLGGCLNFSLTQQVSAIVSQDCTAEGTSNEEMDETYHGFDSFMDSLQVKASKVEHTHITLLHAPPSPQEEVIDDEVVVDNNTNEKEEATEICDEISFDDEDENPYDVDLYSAGVSIRCSPVAIEDDIEDEVHGPSTPTKAQLKQKQQHTEALRGIELLSSGSSRKKLLSPGGSRGGARKASKANRLEPYENGRPTSTTRSLRPLSRSTLSSSGSVRKGTGLEHHDSAGGGGERTPLKLRTNELESSGKFSLAGINSPPSSAVRRRKCSGPTVTKLEVVGADTNSSGLKTPDYTAVRRRSIGSSRSNLKKPVNTLTVVADRDTGTRQPKKHTEGMLPSNLEHRVEGKTSRATKKDNTTAEGAVNHDSKIDQQEFGHSRLPHRRETFSKISQNIDETPSMLDLSIMKFNGEVQMKREDSFAKLSKRIISQQQSLSPTKRINTNTNRVRHTIVNGGAIYS